MTRTGANRALVLGVLSLLLGVLGPFAIWSAVRSLRRIRAAHGPAPGESRATLALVLGLVSTALMVVGVARFVVAGGLL